MYYYDFKELNDIEFEELSKDLVELDLEVKLRLYKKGKDKGIDFSRGFTDKGQEIIGQVKHYVNSKFSDLKYSLTKEKKKIELLNCERYIISTSLDLSVKENEEIFKIMDPYIKSHDDIYDRKKLNSILSTKGSEIEKKFFKLWINNTNILETVLNKSLHDTTKWFLEEINNKPKYYVVTKNFSEALKIINKKNILIIHGEPGIGKTTLAEMIILDFLRKDYNFYFFRGFTTELETIIKDSSTKQIILIDDFLGKNLLELNNNDQTRFETFLERAIKSNKKVILTTRTYIYNNSSFEIFSIEKHNIQEFLLPIGSYSKIEKAKILYNHLYFEENKKNFRMIAQNKTYMKIIEHKNYNPRIIKMISKEENTKEFDEKKYIDYIFQKLDNPEDIWKYEYEKLSKKEKMIINIIGSFSGVVTEEKLKKVFETIYNDDFLEYDKLVDSFISVKLFLNTREKVLQFINPSISDYILKNTFVKEAVYNKIKDNILYLNQIKFIGKINDNNLKKEEKILDVFILRWNSLRESEIDKILFLVENYKNDILANKDYHSYSLICSNYTQSSYMFDTYIEFLIQLIELNPQVFENFNYLNLLSGITKISHFSKFIDLIKKKHELDSFFILHKFEIENLILKVLNYELDKIEVKEAFFNSSYYENNEFSEEDLSSYKWECLESFFYNISSLFEDTYINIEHFKNIIMKKMGPTSYYYDDFEDIKYGMNLEEEDDDDDDDDYNYDSRGEEFSLNENDEIERLFEEV